MIRLSKASVDLQELEGIKKIFDTSVHFGLGETVQEFEHKIADYLATDYSVVCLNSGTAALHIALEACMFPPNSEVIVPSITYLSSFSAISAAGHTPVPCDVLNPSCMIDIESAKSLISNKTVAIMPISYSGYDFDREKLYELAESSNLRVIEDNAHSFGSKTQQGSMIGSIGDISCFSFDGIKNITCFEGGAIVSGDPQLVEIARTKRGLGIEKDSENRYRGKRTWQFDVNCQGYRYHMSNINASVGMAQLKKLNFFKERKKALMEYYIQKISQSSIAQRLVYTQGNIEGNDVCPHILPFTLCKSIDRDVLRKKLHEVGIETGIHYQPNHQLSMYQSAYDLPNANTLGETLISLPFHCDIREEEVDVVVESISKIIQY